MNQDKYWATPEEASLKSWPEAAQARIVSVEQVEDGVVRVHVKVGPDYDEVDYVWQSISGWQAG